MKAQVEEARDEAGRVGGWGKTPRLAPRFRLYYFLPAFDNDM